MIRIENLNKTYFGASPLHVLKGINLNVDKGEFLSIMGSSGSGKSTLLNILGILDTYDSGNYFLDDVLIKNLSETKAAELRNKKIGFVFQSFNLIPFKNAMENVALPLYYQGVSRKKRNMLALEYLDKMGLKSHADHLPSEMSGGQKQRVAIARALIAEPQIILADEPTGALDSKTSEDVMNILRDVNSRDGITMIIVTHEQGVAEATDRIIHIKDGIISKNEDRKAIHLQSKEDKINQTENEGINLHKISEPNQNTHVLVTPISVKQEDTKKSEKTESVVDIVNSNISEDSAETEDSIKSTELEKKEISYLIPQIQIIENTDIENTAQVETSISKRTEHKKIELSIDKSTKDEVTKDPKDDKDSSNSQRRKSDPGRKWQYI